MLTESSLKKAIVGHVLIIAAASLFLAYLGKPVEAKSLIYGGALAVVNALIMIRRIRKGLELPGAGSLIYLQLGFLFRFLLFMLAVGFAAKYLKLDILLVLAGFILFQAFIIKEVIRNLKLQSKGNQSGRS